MQRCIMAHRWHIDGVRAASIVVDMRVLSASGTNEPAASDIATALAADVALGRNISSFAIDGVTVESADLPTGIYSYVLIVMAL